MAKDWNIVAGTIGIMLTVGGITSIISLAQITPRSFTGLIISILAGIVGIIVMAVAFSNK
jgi:hypothetical protein